MLVFGDRQERVDPRQSARDINRQLDKIEHASPGLERHSALVGALVEGGRLLQGLADADFNERGCDRRTAAADELSEILTDVARALCRSWDTGFAKTGRLPRLQSRDGWPREIDLKVPEGFAFYAVYPEAYVEAARKLRLTGPPRVIGIRSIGTTLAAVAAAALRAPLPVTVRPFGDPFARKIALDPQLERELLECESHYVVVDEGPGRSGSSFAAVAGWLRERGVAQERIAFLPSHGGDPGPSATEERRDWWRNTQREVGDFGDRWSALIGRWCAAALGPLDEAPQEISGGTWRQLHYAREQDWPAVVPAWERRKFLVRRGGERFLVKFAGLGRIGEDKLATARALHSDGLGADPVGLVHGFLAERWCEDATPLGPDEKPVRGIGHYIGARARLLPAMSGSGATIQQLLEMLGQNVSSELGRGFSRGLEQWERRAGDLEQRVVRVRTDNKLGRHEWLRSSAGTLIKTDALDHHAAHDLIGCQDAAWDVAGAIVEFDLDQMDTETLIASVEHSGRLEIDRDLLRFSRLAYAAFRLGQMRLASGTVWETSERQRICRSGDRYAAVLQHLLESSQPVKPRKSSVG